MPLVSVICLCYNHAQFVEEALRSVLAQTYSAIELIIVDDASMDESVTLIQRFLKNCSTAYTIQTVFLPQNLGNCAAFNRGLALAQGKYVIDFATDDVMLPQRIEQQATFFEQLSKQYGVIFSEAQYINEKGQFLRYHHQDLLRHLRPIPTGDVYAQLLSTYFISPPTMMMKKQVLDELGGYDEQLAYEDFDFWIRSSRNHYYAYQDVCTTLVRKHARSKSASLYRPGDPQLHSTYQVCLKAKALNRTKKDEQALRRRVKYELRQALLSDQQEEAALFLTLLKERKSAYWFYNVLFWLNKRFIKLRWVKRVFRSKSLKIGYTTLVRWWMAKCNAPP